jgi:hypothetical protein
LAVRGGANRGGIPLAHVSKRPNLDGRRSDMTPETTEAQLLGQWAGLVATAACN